MNEKTPKLYNPFERHKYDEHVMSPYELIKPVEETCRHGVSVYKSCTQCLEYERGY